MNNSNQRQLDFCAFYVLEQLSATSAYQRAFPNSSDDSARASAAKLLASDNIKQEIQALRSRKEAQLMKAVTNEVKEDYWTQSKINELRRELYESTNQDSIRAKLLSDAQSALPEVDGPQATTIVTWGLDVQEAIEQSKRDKDKDTIDLVD
jgi:predicted NAD-dependent protein-ADP-ribosyltransferase YbiA (DUF1768 family)